MNRRCAHTSGTLDRPIGDARGPTNFLLMITFGTEAKVFFFFNYNVTHKKRTNWKI